MIPFAHALHQSLKHEVLWVQVTSRELGWSLLVYILEILGEVRLLGFLVNTLVSAVHMLWLSDWSLVQCWLARLREVILTVCYTRWVDRVFSYTLVPLVFNIRNRLLIIGLSLSYVLLYIVVKRFFWLSIFNYFCLTPLNNISILLLLLNQINVLVYVINVIISLKVIHIIVIFIISFLARLRLLGTQHRLLILLQLLVHLYPLLLYDFHPIPYYLIHFTLCYCHLVFVCILTSYTTFQTARQRTLLLTTVEIAFTFLMILIMIIVCTVTHRRNGWKGSLFQTVAHIFRASVMLRDVRSRHQIGLMLLILSGEGFILGLLDVLLVGWVRGKSKVPLIDFLTFLLNVIYNHNTLFILWLRPRWLLLKRSLIHHILKLSFI